MASLNFPRPLVSAFAVSTAAFSLAACAGSAPEPPRTSAATHVSAGQSVAWGTAVLRQDAGWYGSASARALADSVIQWQSPQGGFPKSTDLSKIPTQAEYATTLNGGRANTFDNDGTTLPLEFLARVVTATGDARYREAFDKGLAYTLEAQYDNGGWPQFYPLREGYYSRITLNDGVMARVIDFLQGVASGAQPYAFVSASDRAAAGAAAAKGIDLLLRLQVVQDGKPTVWAAQYDENTLKPAWARKYEPPSLSGSESVDVTRLLMQIENPSPEIVRAVEGAVAWFRENAIRGQRYERFTDASGNEDARVVPDPSAPPIWARFYELGTNRPIFLGRDSVVRYNLSEIEQERRGGYNYYGNSAASLLERDYPAWKQRLAAR